MEKTFKSIEEIDKEIEQKNEELEVLNDFKKRWLEEEKPKFNEPWRPKKGEEYYMNYCGTTIKNIRGLFEDIAELPINCFKTREEAEQRLKEIKVYNLLKNFSLANGSNDIDYYNNQQDKYFISYDVEDKEFRILNSKTSKICFNEVAFASVDVAEEALRRYKKELEDILK
jgi:hypothetical protein